MELFTAFDNNAITQHLFCTSIVRERIGKLLFFAMQKVHFHAGSAIFCRILFLKKYVVDVKDLITLKV